MFGFMLILQFQFSFPFRFPLFARCAGVAFLSCYTVLRLAVCLSVLPPFKLNADFAQLVGYCFNAVVHCFRFGRCALLGFAVLALQVLVLLLQVAADLHILTVCERIYGYHAIASWFACQFAQFFCVYWQKPLAVAVPAMYRLRVHSGHCGKLFLLFLSILSIFQSSSFNFCCSSSIN